MIIKCWIQRACVKLNPLLGSQIACIVGTKKRREGGENCTIEEGFLLSPIASSFSSPFEACHTGQVTEELFNWNLNSYPPQTQSVQKSFLNSAIWKWRGLKNRFHWADTGTPTRPFFIPRLWKPLIFLALGPKFTNFFFGKICLNKRLYHNLLISTIFLEYHFF